jgi:hypothetical protein
MITPTANVFFSFGYSPERYIDLPAMPCNGLTLYGFCKCHAECLM